MNCSKIHEQDCSVRLEQADSFLEKCFPGAGSRAKALRKISLETLPPAGAPRSKVLDAGSPRAHRRACRDLPGDDEFDFRADGLGAWPVRSPLLARNQGIFAI